MKEVQPVDLEHQPRPVNRRHFLFGALAATGATLLAACAGGGTSPAPGGGGAPPAAKAPASPVAAANSIVFWHSMSGVNGEAVNHLVEGFQQSQKQINVQAIFQGNYDDSLAKLKTALASNSAPAMIQIFDIGQRFMIDSEEIVPMQDFVDRDKFALDDFEAAILNYYRVPDKLYSMPFNASSAILYYNKTAFKEAGLDPEKPPKTIDEVTEYSRKLVKKSGGDVAQFGFHQSVYGWLFEQYMGVSASLYADNANGREARATKVVFDNDKGKAILDWWKAGNADGLFFNPGIDNDGSANAFNAGKSAMYVESTARLRGHINTIQGKFDLGTGFFPRPANPPAEGGNLIGGASLYILKSRPPAEQQAAWEFIKYVLSPPAQSQWQSETGYFAIRKSAENEPAAKEWTTKYPQFTTALNQIRQAPQNRMTQGAVLGVFPQARSRVEKALESLLLGQASSEAALKSAAEEINQAIGTYNKSVKA
jgi:sn-glycerol 3-phosphate transport system substrate-binding protein